MLYFVLLLVVVALIAAGASTRTKHAQRGSHRPRRQAGTPCSNTEAASPFQRDSSRSRQSDSPGPVGTIEWLGRGKSLVVHGFTINDPLTFSGTGHAPDPGYSPAIDPSQIDASLAINRTTSAAEMVYWPWYEAIEPHHRFIYLTWIVTDRRSLPPTDRYMFLFYHGLELRVLVDDADQALVFAEVFRLRKMHAGSRERTAAASKGFFYHCFCVTPAFLTAPGPIERARERIKAHIRLCATTVKMDGGFSNRLKVSLGLLRLSPKWWVFRSE